MPESHETESLPVAEARSGNPEAWDVLFKRFQLPLYAFVFEWLRQEQPSLDVVQETFIKAAKYIHQLRSDDKFGSWLFGIAHQTCAQHSRKLYPTHPLPEDLDLPPEFQDLSANPLEALQQNEDESEFFQHLQNLPEEHRTVLVLHFLEEFSLEEIAGIVNAPIGTVKSRLHYAKTSLRKKCLSGKEPTR